jgi:ligand-binding sensor domain-containing protein
VFASSFAQNKQLRAYTIEDGLPQSQVLDVVQDDMGYLWLGTQGGGLCNFDGETFQVWKEKDGLLSNYIHALYVSEDVVYIGSKRGLSIKRKETFINIEAPEVNKIYVFKSYIYIATVKGLYHLKDDNTLQKITINKDINSSDIKEITYYGDYYWLATNKGFWRLSSLNKTAETIERLEFNDFTAVTAYKDHIYAATFDDGTFIYNIDAIQRPILMREPLNINAMSILNEDELWISTHNDGVSIIDTKTNSEKAYINTKTGLAVPHIRKVIADKQSNIWIATSGWGLYKYFQNNFQHFNRNNGLKGNRVYAVHKAKNALWLSNSEKGLVKIDTGGIQQISGYKTFADVKIKTIASDKKGNIWAGSDGRGLLYRETKTVDSVAIDSSDVFNIKEERFTKTVIKNHILNSETGFPHNWIRKVLVEDDNIWAASYSGGITNFSYNAEYEKLSIKKTYRSKEGIADLYIKTMVKDNQDRLWYGTKNGDLGYIKNGKVTHLKAVLDRKISIGTLLFQNDKLFIGTAGRGIWWATLENEGISDFKKLNGDKKVYSENIYQLIFDNQGYLWVGTESGVDKITLNQENTIVDAVHFGRNDGFLGIETCLNAVEKDEKGHLWFGAIYGLTQYKPSEISKESLKPKVHFKDLQVNFKTVDSITIKQWVENSTVLQLNPKQTQIGFTYKTVDLDHPTEIQYRTKLDVKDWSPWTTNNTQSLRGLEYGAHKFKVQSRNNRWQNSDPIVFEFYMDSPLLKKTWFRWTIISIIIGLLALFTWRYIKRLKRENKAEQERLKLENHLLSLEQKALRLQMNPHFIFNVLNGIKAMAITKPDKMNNTINNFATLLRETLINSRKETITLEQEIKTLRHYIEVEKLMAEKTFEHTITVNCDLDPEEILVPPMLIQPFVENAIRHGILKGQKEGQLDITFKTTETHLHCTIKDNGIGIFTSQEAKPKTDHQSMALKVTQERLESISGVNALQISEIKKNDGTVEGTNITFKIPLETDY